MKTLIRETEIIEKTEALLKELGKEEYPINLNKVAKNLKIGIFEFEFEDSNVHAALYTDKKDGSNIFVSKELTEEKKRFGIAHEIGHFVLHEKKKSIYYKTKKKGTEEIQEKEADDFAGELLMPLDAVKSAYKSIMGEFSAIGMEETTKKKNLIKILTKYFSVTEKTLKHRLKNLGLNY